MGITAAVVAATAVVAGTAKTVTDANAQKHQADDLATNQKNAQQKLIDDQKAEEENQASQSAANDAQQTAIQAQRQKAAGFQGVNSTILTSPLGVQSSAPVTGGKTLLGS